MIAIYSPEVAEASDEGSLGAGEGDGQQRPREDGPATLAVGFPVGFSVGIVGHALVSQCVR